MNHGANSDHFTIINFVEILLVDLSCQRSFGNDIFERAHFLNALQHSEEVVEIKMTFHHPMSTACSLLFVDGFSEILHEPNNVAQSQDPCRHSFGSKLLQAI